MAKPVNEIRCKDCLLSGWDVDPKGVWFSCGYRLVPDKVMAVRTALKFLVVDCDHVREGKRHGGGPGTLTVFDIASGKRLETPQDVVKTHPSDNLPKVHVISMHKVSELGRTPGSKQMTLELTQVETKKRICGWPFANDCLHRGQKMSCNKRWNLDGLGDDLPKTCPHFMLRSADNETVDKMIKTGSAFGYTTIEGALYVNGGK